MPRKGENIYKRKDGRWEARFIHHYENGKAKYQYIYGASYSEVKEKRQAAIAANGRITASAVKSRSQVTEIARLWLLDTKSTVKESTYTRYYATVEKHMLTHIGQLMLKTIDTEMLTTTLEKIRAGDTGHPLSARTFSGIVRIWKAIWRWGEQHGYPCCDFPHISIQQKKSKTVKIIPPESRQLIETKLMDSEDLTGLGIIFSLFTGVRIGELCGLRWGDFDLENGLVTISRTVERIADLDPSTARKTKVILSEPKTEDSIRVIPLPVFLLNHLRKKKKPDGCYLLTGHTRYTEPHCCYVRYKRFLQRNGLENYTFHALRHTFATTCVDIGFDPKSLSEILGHANVTTTMELYIHPTMQMKKRQMDMLMPMAYSPSKP